MNILANFKALSMFLSLLACASSFSPARSSTSNGKSQRVIIIMMDGFGEEYYRNSQMPNLNRIEKDGIFKIVPSLMPSVTNVNTAGIVTGELPDVNGITGNSYYDLEKQQEEFMEDSTLLLSQTIFERAKREGVRSALFSSKKKTVSLLGRGTDLTLSPETASDEWIKRMGTPPSIYSREVNYWLFEAALYTMQHDPTIGLYYIHPTDYPMHTWNPQDPNSQEHLKKIDEYLGKILAFDPDAMILITADHTVNHKSLCLDLERLLISQGLHVKIAISAERDKYVKHHRGFGGTAYVYLDKPQNAIAITNALRNTKGIQQVLSREDAVTQFHLLPSRIGDLVVLGDSLTVFGTMDSPSENLPDSFRTHGSLYEARVPLFLFNAKSSPRPDFFDQNYKIASWLFR